MGQPTATSKRSERPEELLTVPTAAERIGIRVEYLREAIKDGELDAYRVKGWWRVRMSAVTRWLESLRYITPKGSNGSGRNR